MKSLVIYDSFYGNTEQIARSVASAIGSGAEVCRATETSPSKLLTFDLVIFGSPTQGGRPTKPLQELIKNLPTLKGIKVASFDTRFSNPIVKIFGFAADRIAASLTQKGGQLLAPPTWFFVETEKGPLKEGELERAAAWAQELIK